MIESGSYNHFKYFKWRVCVCVFSLSEYENWITWYGSLKEMTPQME